MFKSAYFLAALALTAAAHVPLPEDADDLENALDSDIPGALDTRMVGGEIVADYNAYSFMVGIQPKYVPYGQTAQAMAPFCTGILIRGSTGTGATAATAHFVLTSAHCAQSGTSYDFYAGNGKITATSTALDVAVLSSTAVINDEFRETSMTGDLAIIPTKIDPSTTSLTQPISTAVLASISDAAKSYLINTVTMAGWGFPNDAYTEHSPSLRALSSWVVPNWYCAVRHISKPIKNTHVCTAGLPNKGPCTGDSGAPLIAQLTTTSSSSGSTTTRKVVIGLATQTPRNGCSRGRPGVFTRITDYLDWIIQVTNYDPDAPTA